MYIAQMTPFMYNISQDKKNEILNNISQYLLALYVIKLLYYPKLLLAKPWVQKCVSM